MYLQFVSKGLLPSFCVPYMLLSLLQVIELCRPSDSRLEHVDFECLFSSLSLRLLLRVFASLLLERRVIFTADKLRLALVLLGSATVLFSLFAS